MTSTSTTHHGADGTIPCDNNRDSTNDTTTTTTTAQATTFSPPTLALLNARRIVGMSQLCSAANLACQRPTSPTWDTVFLVAASTHLGHVLRDYAFVRNNNDDDNDDDDDATMVDEEKEYMVIVFMISNLGLELYQSLLEEHGLSGDTTMDLEDYLQRQRETSAHEFQSWYKLTTQELASSSLEACVLTKIATKMA